jgi:predicted ribosomally synthesized peptide with nif11-like leader
MSMFDALHFISSCRNDDAFRGMLYDFRGPQEFRSFVKDSGFDFTDAEIGNALSGLKLRAHDEFEAEEIAELGQWYSVLANAGAELSCAGCRGSC